MSYAISYNSSHQAEGDTTKSITFHTIYPSDFAEVRNDPGKRKLTNVASPIGYPETVEVDSRQIADVYSGSSISKSLWLPTKTGTQVRTELRQVWTYADASDATAPTYALPVSSSLMIKIPNAPFLTKNDVLEILYRQLGLWYSNAADHIDEWFRGALTIE